MKLSAKLKHMLEGSALTLLLCGSALGGYSVYNHYQMNHPTIINASSSLYQKVRRNDLHYLHKVGNHKAKLANDEAQRFSYSSKPSDNRYPIYHHDKHGNYWSWFEDHQAVGNDDFDIGQSDDGDTFISNQKSRSGILSNEAVLRNHGVHSGVNFYYFTK